MLNVFTKTCNLWYLLTFFVVNYSFAQIHPDTIFIKDLGINNVKNISVFGEKLYFRRNDSLFVLNDNTSEFVTKVDKYYSYIDYNLFKKEMVVINTIFPKNRKTATLSIFPGRTTGVITDGSISNYYYLCYNGRILKYQINDFYKLNYPGKSIRSICLTSDKLIVGSYSGVFRSDFRLNKIDTIKNIDYVNGEINSIGDFIFLCEDQLKIIENGDSAMLINSASDGDRFRKIIKYKKGYLALKTESFEIFDLIPNYKSIKKYKFKFKPTDLEYDKKIYFSNENGEICTFDKKIKISNHPIVDFDIKHNVIIAVSKNELFILRKSNLTLLKKYELNETIFEVASNGENIIICTDNKLLILSDEKFYSLLENVEFNSRAIYINKGIIYVGSINGLYTIDLNYVRYDLFPKIKYQVIKSTNIKNQTIDFKFLLVIIIIALSVIFYFILKKRKINLNTEIKLNEITLEEIESIIKNENVKNVNELASYFKVSRVTINKKINQLGFKPIDLIKSIKHNLVLEYYFNEKLSIKDISNKIGYTENKINQIIKSNL
jgi:AraC-like DNA-binding protein